MIQVYVYYPNPRISVHHDASCANIGMGRKSGQRKVAIDASSVSAELLKFQHREYRFGSTSATNDMWLTIDFDDTQYEHEVLGHIQQLIGEHYRPLKTAEIQTHCDMGYRSGLKSNFMTADPVGEYQPVPGTGHLPPVQNGYSKDQASYIEKQLRQLEEKIKGASSGDV